MATTTNNSSNVEEYSITLQQFYQQNPLAEQAVIMPCISADGESFNAFMVPTDKRDAITGKTICKFYGLSKALTDDGVELTEDWLIANANNIRIAEATEGRKFGTLFIGRGLKKMTAALLFGSR